MLLKQTNRQTTTTTTSLSVTKKARGIVKLNNYISVLICAKIPD